MDTGTFIAAHEAFEREILRSDDCECDGWSARPVAAHVIGTDRLLTKTASRILFGARLMYGKPATYDAESSAAPAPQGDRGQHRGQTRDCGRARPQPVRTGGDRVTADALGRRNRGPGVDRRWSPRSRRRPAVPFGALLGTHARAHIPAHGVEVVEKTLTRTG